MLGTLRAGARSSDSRARRAGEVGRGGLQPPRPVLERDVGQGGLSILFLHPRYMLSTTPPRPRRAPGRCFPLSAGFGDGPGPLATPKPLPLSLPAAPSPPIPSQPLHPAPSLVLFRVQTHRARSQGGWGGPAEWDRMGRGDIGGTGTPQPREGPLHAVSGTAGNTRGVFSWHAWADGHPIPAGTELARSLAVPWSPRGRPQKGPLVEGN